jgi:small GTP-binding protein
MRTVQKKVCLLGDFAVGKTSLIRRFVEGRFDEAYLSTIGVNISRKSVTRPDHTLNLLIWDLAGGDDYKGASASYLRGAAGALIVCDLTREETLAAYQRYATQLRAVNAQAALVFVANKADLTDQRAISEDSLQSVSDMLGGPFLLTSAKTDRQVEDAFRLLAERIEANS